MQNIIQEEQKINSRDGLVESSHREEQQFVNNIYLDCA